jgi:predicted ATP-binding protein involved in virulence
MFLRSLYLENIRSIGELEISFETENAENRKWTILLGENGTGKSTILRAAALLLAGSDSLPALLRTPEIWVRNGKKSGRIEGVITTAEGDSRKVTVDIKQNEAMGSMLKRNDRNLKKLDAALAWNPRSYFVVGYGASRRLPADEAPKFSNAETYSHPRARAVATLFSRDASLRSVDSWAMDVHYRKKEAGLTLIRSAMDELLPGVKFEGINKESRQLIFDTPDGKVPLQQLSDGYQNMASWIGDLLFRITDSFKQYKKPLEARGLLLLDEVDLHLHPTWQRQVLDFLDKKLPNFQVLATTHSPFTAQQAPLDALHVLERSALLKGKEAPVLVAKQFHGNPKLLRVEQLIEPLLGLETAESLAAQRAREQQKGLKEKQKLTSAEKQDLAELTGVLKLLPRQQTSDPEKIKNLELLERIDKHFSRNRTNGGPRNTPSIDLTVAEAEAVLDRVEALPRPPQKTSSKSKLPKRVK